MPKTSSDLSREDLIALIEERAEDVCGGKMYEVEVKIDELEEDLKASKEIIKNLEQSLKQTQSDLQTLSDENKQLKGLVNMLQENKELRSNNELVQLKKEIDVLKKDKPVKAQAIEVKKLQQEVEELRVIREEVKEINDCKSKQVSDLGEKITKLEAENDQKSRKIRSMEFKWGKDKSKIKDLLITVDELQQNQHRSSVQLVGLPESDSKEADEKKVVKLARDKTGLKLKKDDFLEVYRLGKKCDGKNRDLVIKFTNMKTRDIFHENRKKTAPHKDPAKNIYVNDVLTTYRKGLFYAARKLCKAHKLCAAWTQQGNVLVRKTEGDKATEIKCYDDLIPFRDSHYSYSDSYSETNPMENLEDNDELSSHLSDYSY